MEQSGTMEGSIAMLVLFTRKVCRQLENYATLTIRISRLNSRSTNNNLFSLGPCWLKFWGQVVTGKSVKLIGRSNG